MTENPRDTGFPLPSRMLRLGFVGGGQGAFIGEVHANGALLSKRWQIVAGALSSNPLRAKDSGRKWMLAEDRIYTDFREMAAREAGRSDGIDAVVITTPNHLHHPVAAGFMDAGIDVISDKPLTTTLADARDLVRRQRDTGLVFGVTYAYASHVMVRQAREMIRAGMLGEIRQVHVEYFQEWALNLTDEDGTPPWRLDPAKVGNAFTVGDIGTHAAHLASFATGRDIELVRALFHVAGKPKALEDTAFMHLRFEGGVPGTLMVSQAAAGTQCGLRLRVFGTLAGLEWNQENPEFLSFTPQDSPMQIIGRGYGAGMLPAAVRFVRMPRGHPEALTDAWANLYTELAVAVDARRTGRTVPEGLLAYPTVVDGAKGVKFVEAAVRSNATGDWVDCGL
ncbi:Gfo/Idh/MocA family oxidoreductase [Mesorhizobium sp. B2-6-2]|uniref:Gfo/Idh/MocA family protein n=1 Tax=Mesorhizobium sp. B2-6-2 TaxID=2589915 RepID=UPI00112AFD99|nr:Gfo/Idh/MocA family oxidoreductase [Mesorhizobium sp. B2-6-2]TPJ79142.1 Gfo/Idh/MocA family oxidoreductase [Mesorhizobium sp. B2-6-2]